jgi:hypothetical protein
MMIPLWFTRRGDPLFDIDQLTIARPADREVG